MSHSFIVTVYDMHPRTGIYSRVFDDSVEVCRIIAWARNATQDPLVSISDLVFSEFTGTSI